MHGSAEAGSWKTRVMFFLSNSAMGALKSFFGTPVIRVYTLGFSWKAGMFTTHSGWIGGTRGSSKRVWSSEYFPSDPRAMPWVVRGTSSLMSVIWLGTL